MTSLLKLTLAAARRISGKNKQLMNTLITSYGIDRFSNEFEHNVYCDKHLPESWTATEFSRRKVADPCIVCAFEWNKKIVEFTERNPCLQNLNFDSLTYISGPMSGLPDHNKPAFWVAEDAFKRQGYRILTPAHWPDNKTYEWYMTQDIKMVLECTQMFMLKGWIKSPGACCEHEVARLTGKTIIEEL